jgi:hypothetical protein
MSRSGVAIVCVSAALAFALGRLTGGEGLGGAPPSWQELLGERDPLTRMAQLSTALETLHQGNIEAAVAALEAQQDSVSPEEVRLFMLAWTRFDGPGAFRWAHEWPTRWSSTLRGEAMFAWAYNDGRAAAQTLESLDDEELEATLRSRMMEGWLRSGDTDSVGDYIATVADPRRRRRLTFLLTGEISRGGPDALMRWVEELPADSANEFKQGAFYHAAGEVARTDPDRAAAWFESHRAAPYARGSLDHIARKWAHHHDPSALFGWLKGLDLAPGEVEGALAAGYRVWLGGDAEAAEAWILSELPDPGLDPAVWELVRARAEKEPRVAIDWALRLEDPDMRRKGLIRAGRSLFRRNREAGEAWLAQSDLPEEDRESIRRAPPMKRRGIRRRGADGAPTLAPG